MSNLTLETLYAQPDGKFRSNEKYDKILAEIAKEPPFKKDTGIGELSEPSRYKELKELYKNYESTEAIQNFTNDLLTGQPFDFDTWQALVTDVTVSIAGDSRIAVYQFHFYELEKNFKQLTHISGVDILDMYVVILLADLKLYKGYKT